MVGRTITTVLMCSKYVTLRTLINNNYWYASSIPTHSVALIQSAIIAIAIPTL